MKRLKENYAFIAFIGFVFMFLGVFLYVNIGKINGEINGVSYDNCTGLAFEPNCALEKCAGLIASYLHDYDERLYWEVSEMNCHLEELLSK